MRDEVAVTDIFLAALLLYNGCECIRVTINGREAEYLFICKQFDFEAIQQEFSDPKNTVYMQDFINAYRRANEYVRRAKDKMGVWCAAGYATRRHG